MTERKEQKGTYRSLLSKSFSDKRKRSTRWRVPWCACLLGRAGVSGLWFLSGFWLGDFGFKFSECGGGYKFGSNGLGLGDTRSRC